MHGRGRRRSRSPEVPASQRAFSISARSLLPRVLATTTRRNGHPEYRQLGVANRGLGAVASLRKPTSASATMDCFHCIHSTLANRLHHLVLQAGARRATNISSLFDVCGVLVWGDDSACRDAASVSSHRASWALRNCRGAISDKS